MASNLTMAFIGCGNMGSAILSGILSATRASPAGTGEDKGNSADDSDGNSAKISRFIISTKTTQSAERLRARFSTDGDESRITFLSSQNIRAMKEADIIVLACKPYMAEDVLGEDGVGEALSGKMLVSVLAGKTVHQLGEYISQSQQGYIGDTRRKPFMIRTQPNVAASIQQSMTIIETPDSSLPDSFADALTWMFEQVGQVKFLPHESFNTGTMLVGASMGILSIPLDGMLDGGVAEGIRRNEGMELVAQALEGMAGLLKSGVHPAVLRENISSPRGCTIQALLRLEREGVRGSFAQAVIDGVGHLGR